MVQTTVKITGMTCGACQRVIEKRVGKIEGVSKVKVHLNESKAEIEADRELSLEEISQVLTDTDYKITNLN